ncbi:class II aldolase/adducin family protein [Irregularibacter muris]|uniref:Class II aldolase/adducin family protein n=1 Tax=Irregularibacter muris TaxID=1796619 RepID=A0AAE3KZA6_9FIRM|nr:class II aldolase/adducin family protein [Irregularibacter muris]MCR1898426.1 class II aldolase/adducin family protein [Irregularibacter muris]
MLYELERREMCRIVKSMFDRWTTNVAGGNLSAKVDEGIFIMTPTLMSEEQLWNPNPEGILVVDKDLNIIEGVGKLTREINMHMAIYHTDKRVNAVIHAHPKEMMAFATMGIDMPLVCENVGKLGEAFPCLPYAPAVSEELANAVTTFIKEEILPTGVQPPYGALLRGHGVILAGDGLASTNNILERLEINAYTYVQSIALQSAGFKYDHK